MPIPFLGRRFSFDVPASRTDVAERLHQNHRSVDANPAQFGAFVNERRVILWAGYANQDIHLLYATLGDCEAGCRIEGRTSFTALRGVLIVLTLILIVGVMGQYVAGHLVGSIWANIGVLSLIFLMFLMITLWNDEIGRDLLRALKMWAKTDLDRDTVRWAGIPVICRVTVDGDGMQERVITDAVTMFGMLHSLHPDGGAFIMKRGEGDNLQFNRNDERFHIDRRSPEESRPLRAVKTREPVIDTFSLEEAMDVAMDYLSNKPLDQRVSWQRLA